MTRRGPNKAVSSAAERRFRVGGRRRHLRDGGLPLPRAQALPLALQGRVQCSQALWRCSSAAASTPPRSPGAKLPAIDLLNDSPAVGLGATVGHSLPHRSPAKTGAQPSKDSKDLRSAYGSRRNGFPFAGGCSVPCAAAASAAFSYSSTSLLKDSIARGSLVWAARRRHFSAIPRKCASLEISCINNNVADRRQPTLIYISVNKAFSSYARFGEAGSSSTRTGSGRGHRGRSRRSLRLPPGQPR